MIYEIEKTLSHIAFFQKELNFFGDNTKKSRTIINKLESINKDLNRYKKNKKDEDLEKLKNSFYFIKGLCINIYDVYKNNLIRNIEEIYKNINRKYIDDVEWSQIELEKTLELEFLNKDRYSVVNNFQELDLVLIEQFSYKSKIIKYVLDIYFPAILIKDFRKSLPKYKEFILEKLVSIIEDENILNKISEEIKSEEELNSYEELIGIFCNKINSYATEENKLNCKGFKYKNSFFINFKDKNINLSVSLEDNSNEN